MSFFLFIKKYSRNTDIPIVKYVQVDEQQVDLYAQWAVPV